MRYGAWAACIWAPAETPDAAIQDAHQRYPKRSFVQSGRWRKASSIGTAMDAIIRMRFFEARPVERLDSYAPPVPLGPVQPGR